MALENVKAFYKELEANQELQKKIAAADAAYNGDTEDKKAAVEAIILPIAKEVGFDFTAEELISFKPSAQNEDCEFTEDELEAVAGGGWCLILGFGERDCKTICKYVGVGLPWEWNC